MQIRKIYRTNPNTNQEAKGDIEFTSYGLSFFRINNGSAIWEKYVPIGSTGFTGTFGVPTYSQNTYVSGLWPYFGITELKMQPSDLRPRPWEMTPGY